MYRYVNAFYFTWSSPCFSTLPTILSSSTSNDASTIPCSRSNDVRGVHILLPPSSSNVPMQLQQYAETEAEAKAETTAVVVVVCGSGSIRCRSRAVEKC